MDFGCGRGLIHELDEAGLEGVGAQAEVDIVAADTDQAEWYRLSMLALQEPVLASGALTEAEFEEAFAVLDEPGFCEPGFVFVRAHGTRPAR
jgi:hypothetical protein